MWKQKQKKTQTQRPKIGNIQYVYNETVWPSNRDENPSITRHMFSKTLEKGSEETLDLK